MNDSQSQVYVARKFIGVLLMQFPTYGSRSDVPILLHYKYKA